MTAERDSRDFLNDMVHACHAIISFVAGMSLDDYLADEKTRFAVMRAYEMLGEAVRHLPESLKTAHPDIPGPRWRRYGIESYTATSVSTTQSCSPP
ncbi:MAG TPA: HepT-like ribonuclease domain-containing protein [Acetobacteraceae bacterium]|nr:HepT-like ribonuclease domain-containing protein [Acetobacteraceae bacterium]